MKKLLFAVLLVAGCDDGGVQERNELRRQIHELHQEKEELKRNLPSERPAVMKELDAARKTIEDLRGELNAVKVTLDQASKQVPAEVVPLAAMLLDLKTRVAELERTRSKIGHTHTYEDKYPLNTFNSATKTTDPDR